MCIDMILKTYFRPDYLGQVLDMTVERNVPQFVRGQSVAETSVNVSATGSRVILVNIIIKVGKLRTETKIGRNAQNTPFKLLRKFPKFPEGGRYLICIFPRWPPPKRPKP